MKNPENDNRKNKKNPENDNRKNKKNPESDNRKNKKNPENNNEQCDSGIGREPEFISAEARRHYNNPDDRIRDNTIANSSLYPFYHGPEMNNLVPSY